MKSNELRIENWVKRESQPDGFQIDSHSFIVCERDPEMYKPIPLTEKWMKRLGFKKHKWFGHPIERGCTWLIPYNRKFEIFYEKKYGFYHEFYRACKRNSIKYVHQLQNLYFVLTSKELE